jgi:hypothetical protein
VIILATDCTGAALAPGASCAVRLQLMPAGIGTRSAALTALADVTTHEATLHGLGRAASMAWLTGPLDFGNMNVGAQTPTQDAALHNTGNAPAAILSVDVAGHAADFVVTDLTPGITSLQPTGIKGFRIRFKPTAPGNPAGLAADPLRRRGKPVRGHAGGRRPDPTVSAGPHAEACRRERERVGRDLKPIYTARRPGRGPAGARGLRREVGQPLPRPHPGVAEHLGLRDPVPGVPRQGQARDLHHGDTSTVNRPSQPPGV